MPSMIANECQARYAADLAEFDELQNIAEIKNYDCLYVELDLSRGTK